MQDGQQLVGSSGIESVLAGCLPAPALERAPAAGSGERRSDPPYHRGERAGDEPRRNPGCAARPENRRVRHDRRGALNIAILRLLDPSISMRVPVDTAPFRADFAEYALRLTVHGPTRSVTATADLEGVDPIAARTQVDRILDCREPEIGKRLNGAKAPEYGAYGPCNGPFETVEELKLVMG